jgi:hypothetical protein
VQLVIAPNGVVSCVYTDELNLTSLGAVEIRRGSHVEPDSNGNWHVSLAPVQGPALGPFPKRSLALQAEIAWLENHWLIPSAARQHVN